jgi:hypothetical protein
MENVVRISSGMVGGSRAVCRTFARPARAQLAAPLRAKDYSKSDRLFRGVSRHRRRRDAGCGHGVNFLQQFFVGVEFAVFAGIV